MTKSELIEQVAASYPDMTKKQVEFIVKAIFDAITESLKRNERVELRGFGTFNVRFKEEKTARNPKNGQIIKVSAKKTPYFKPGKDIKTTLLDS